MIDVELKRAFKTGKIEIGTKDTENSILFGTAKGVIMSSSAVDVDKLRLKHLCSISKVPFLIVNYIPMELGKVIGLAYPVTSVSVVDEGKSKILSELKE